MPKKQSPGGEKTKKVQTRLSGRLVSRIDRKARAAGETRASELRKTLEKAYSDAPKRGRTYEELVAESQSLRTVAEREELSGLGPQAAATYLLAAAKEIEAASRLSPSKLPADEAKLKSALMMAVQLIKKGSGYRRLPELPDTPSAATVQ